MSHPHKFDLLKSVEITPAGFFLCLLAAIPAGLIAKLFVAVALPVAEAVVFRSQFEGAFAMPFCYFVVYGLGGYFFVWVGAHLTKAFRPFDILLYFVLVTICGLVLMPEITLFGSLGTGWGAAMAVYFLGKSFAASQQDQEAGL